MRGLRATEAESGRATRNFLVGGSFHVCDDDVDNLLAPSLDLREVLETFVKLSST